MYRTHSDFPFPMPSSRIWILKDGTERRYRGTGLELEKPESRGVCVCMDRLGTLSKVFLVGSYRKSCRPRDRTGKSMPLDHLLTDSEMERRHCDVSKQDHPGGQREERVTRFLTVVLPSAGLAAVAAITARSPSPIMLGACRYRCTRGSLSFGA